jgi:hypothetical protein
MHTRLSLLRAFSICLGVAAGLLLGFEGSSAQAASKGQQASKSRTGAAPRVVIGGTSVSQTIFAYDNPDSIVGSAETYATLPGMIVTVTLAKTQLVLATFGAEWARRDDRHWLVIPPRWTDLAKGVEVLRPPHQFNVPSLIAKKWPVLSF